MMILFEATNRQPTKNPSSKYILGGVVVSVGGWVRGRVGAWVLHVCVVWWLGWWLGWWCVLGVCWVCAVCMLGVVNVPSLPGLHPGTPGTR